MRNNEGSLIRGSLFSVKRKIVQDRLFSIHIRTGCV